jgi:hypothetical protein
MNIHTRENAMNHTSTLMKTLIGWPLLRSSSILLAVALACFGLLPLNAFGVVPAPDGGYPGFNTAEGQKALFSLTTGGGNTAIGSFSLFSNTDGSFNTGVGAGTLLFNVGDQSTGEGVENTAIGAAALLFNTIGYDNTAVGTQALFSNTDGAANTATGYQALASNTTGLANTATGSSALRSNTTGSGNTAHGLGALFSNTEGNQNTAIGPSALISNSTGENNTATGFDALFFNHTGSNNTAYGWKALSSNNTGSYYTAVGDQSLYHLSTGSYNVALAGGFNLTSGDFNIDIGNDGVNGDSGVIRIGSSCCQGSAFIAGIWGVTASGGAAVYVNSDGQLGTATSSARFKQDIQDMDKASEALLALRPVTFHYKPELDPNGIPQFGLVAEEVEKVNPDLVVHDKDGKPYTVRYEQVNAMLLNEFLKEHKKVEKLEATLEAINGRLQEQADQIQKVTAQVDATKPLPHLVLNNP